MARIKSHPDLQKHLTENKKSAKKPSSGVSL